MTNEELSNALSPEIEKLKKLNQDAIEIARAIIGESLFKTYLYFCALLNKILQLTDGFIELITQRNINCD